MKVANVMSTTVVTVSPDTPWKLVAERMLDANVSGVPVVDEDGYLVGLVTEADLISRPAFGTGRQRKLDVLMHIVAGDIRWEGKGHGLTADDIMTTNVVTATPDEDVRIAARRMLERKVKRLPVIDNGRVVGIVSRRDLLWVFHRDDRDIANELAEKLASVRYAPEEHAVMFTVSDGVVTLRGTVADESDRPVVEGLTWRIPGVVHVVDEVTSEA